jgi:hypothetical protein
MNVCLHVPIVLTLGVRHDHAECLLCGAVLSIAKAVSA